MGLFSNIAEGWKLFSDSFKVLSRHPVFLVPLFFGWILIAGLILYLRYYFIFPKSLGLVLVEAYLFLFLITFIISLCNVIMLEFVQQIELGKKISFSKAVKEAFVFDLLKVIPVAAIWAFVWFIILLIKVLTSKKRERSTRAKPSVRGAALTLGGAKAGPFSWLKLGLSMFEKIVRMVVFLALPAIAWENKGPFSSFKKAVEIVRKHPVQFLTTFTLTGIAALFMVVPLAIIFYLDKSGVVFSSLFWTGVIIYEGLVWTLSNYLEQMSVCLLYLWHLKWMKKGGIGDLSSVVRPSLLDEIYEFR